MQAQHASTASIRRSIVISDFPKNIRNNPSYNQKTFYSRFLFWLAPQFAHNHNVVSCTANNNHGIVASSRPRRIIASSPFTTISIRAWLKPKRRIYLIKSDEVKTSPPKAMNRRLSNRSHHRPIACVGHGYL